MAVDWKKYGIESDEKKTKKENTSVDWSKYDEPKEKVKPGAALAAKKKPSVTTIGGKSTTSTFDNVRTGKVDAKAFTKDLKKATKTVAKAKAVDERKSLLSKLPERYGDPVSPQKAINDKLPGRDVPVIGTVLKAIDKFSEHKTPQTIAKIGHTVYMPGAGLGNIASFSGAVDNAVSRLLPKLPAYGAAADSAIAKLLPKGTPPTNMTENIIRGAAREGATGAVLGAGAGLPHSESLKDWGQSTLYGTGIGGFTGALGPVLGKAFTEFLKGKKPIEPVQSVLGLPAGRQRGNINAAVTPDVITPYGESVQLGLPESSRYNAIQQLKSEETLGLPSSARYDQIRQRTAPLEPNTTPVAPYGESARLGLPEGNYTAPTRLKVADNNQTLNSVIERIRPEVEEIINVPIRRDLLIDYIERHTGIPRNEIFNIPMKELQDLGQYTRQGLDLPTIAIQTAKTKGYDLAALLDGNAPTIGSKVAGDAQKRAYGIYPETLPNVTKPQMNSSVTGNVEAPLTKVGRAPVKTKKLTKKQEEAKAAALPKTQNAETKGFSRQQEAKSTEIVQNNLARRRQIDELSKPVDGARIAPMNERVGRKPADVEVTPPKRKFPGGQAGSGSKLPTPSDLGIGSGAKTGALPKLSDAATTVSFKKLPKLGQTGELPKPENRRITPINDEAEVEEILKAASEPRIRDKVVSYLDEAEAAARKRIASRKNNLSSLPLDEWADHAIIMAAKIGKGTVKVADFTEDLVRDFGEAARPHAAQILRKSKDVLQQQQRRASQEGAEAEAFNNSGLGNAVSFESKISRKLTPKKKSFSEWWEKFKTQFTEDIAPLNKLEKSVTGKIASAEDSLYKSARLYKGVPEKVNQFIEQKLKPIVRGIEKAGYHSDDLGRYALAKHAKDVNAAGYKSGYTNAEIDDVISKLGTPELEAARTQLISINRELLDGLVDNNVISKEMRDALNDRWKNYVPMFRDVEDVAGRNLGLSDALANVASPIKKLKGGTQNVIDPLENMVHNIAKNIDAAETNKVASFIPKLAKFDPEEKFIRRMTDGEKIEGKNVITVKENGQNVHYEVDKDVKDAMLSLNKETSVWLMRTLAVPASWLRAGATLTPEFIVRNPVRDYRNARIVSESGFRFDDYAVGLASSIMGKFGKGKLYQDWVKNLGAYGNIVSEDRNAFIAAQKKVLTQSATQKIANVSNPMNIVKLLRAMSDISESSTKVGEFRAALRKGASKEEAAYRARDIMDFARAGTSIRQANKVVAFLNANIQGKSKTYRAFKSNPVRTSTRLFTQMALPTAGFYFYNKKFANDTQKETIKNAPDWQKNTFWLVAIPGTSMVGRIPKPFDFAVVANVVQRSLEFFEDNDKEAFEGFAQGAIADNGLPLMITGLQPMLEGAGNHSYFRNSDIIPMRDQDLEYKDQFDPTRTSEAAKFIAKGVDKTLGKLGGNFRSPYIVDNTIQGYFAGGGKYATDAVDAVLGKIGATDRPAKPEKSPELKPVLRSFLVDPNQGGKVTDMFYNQMDKLKRAKASANLHGTSLTIKQQDNLDVLNAANKQLINSGKKIGINNQIRAIEASRELSASEKRKKIDILVDQRMRLIKEALEGIKD